MLRRAADTKLRDLSDQFPAVLLLGPRQCGKTTLAKSCFRGEYFDLERPSDAQIFNGDVELALRRFPGSIVIDEAQLLPSLFPVLRALIDEDRRRTGRFVLLGSVNPALLSSVAESLAGRVGILELTPLLWRESRPAGVSLMDHWLRGGFPDACTQVSSSRWRRWQEAYVQTFVERDVPRTMPRLTSSRMNQFMSMLAHLHGGILNASELGRAMGISYHLVQDYLDLVEGHFLIRRLRPYGSNAGKRLVKAPKLYLRDTGMLHHLLGVGDDRQLLGCPGRGTSFEAFVIEQLIALEQLRNDGSHFWFYRTHTGCEVDLIIDRGHERLGYEIKCATSVSPRDLTHLRRAMDDGVIDRGVVVYLGPRAYTAAPGVEVIPAETLLGD